MIKQSWIEPLCAALAFSVCLLVSAQPAHAQQYVAAPVYTLPYDGSDDPELGSLLIQGSDGNFYGTAFDGESGNGWIYKLTPAGTYSVLHTFVASEEFVEEPSVLLQATDGNLYGVLGTQLFQLTLAGQYTNFMTLTRGAASLIPASDGRLYGTAGYAYDQLAESTIFSVDLQSRTQTVLYTFPDTNTIAETLGSTLVQAGDGNFYGTVIGSNEYNEGGSLFRITASGVFTTLATAGTASLPYVFASNLVAGAGGYLYGYAQPLTTSTYQTLVYRFNPVTGDAGFIYTLPLGTSPAAYDVTAGSDGHMYGLSYGTLASYTGAPNLHLTDFTAGSVIGEFYDGFAATHFSTLLPGADGAFYSTNETLDDESILRISTPAGKAEPLKPPVVMSLSPTQIVSGGKATLSWSAPGQFGDSANVCFASGDWSGVVASSGSITESISAGGNYSFGLTCGGNRSSVATGNVGPQRESTTTTMQIGGVSGDIGTSIAVEAAVSVPSAGVAPTGTVEFLVDGNPFLSVPLSSASASATLNSATFLPGVSKVSATYTGDVNYAPSSAAPRTVTLLGAPAVVVTPSLAATGEGEPISLTVQVLAANGGATPTGTVTLTPVYGPGTVTLTLVNGSVTYNTTTSPNSADVSVIATYNGDSNYQTAQGNAQYETLPDSTVSLQVAPTTLTSGQSAILLATVSTNNSGPDTTPTGTVTFSSDGVIIGTSSVSNGSASLSASSQGIPAGTYPVVARYNGDTSNGAASSTPVSVVIR